MTSIDKIERTAEMYDRNVTDAAEPVSREECVCSYEDK